MNLREWSHPFLSDLLLLLVIFLYYSHILEPLSWISLQIHFDMEFLTEVK